MVAGFITPKATTPGRVRGGSGDGLRLAFDLDPIRAREKLVGKGNENLLADLTAIENVGPVENDAGFFDFVDQAIGESVGRSVAIHHAHDAADLDVFRFDHDS